MIFTTNTGNVTAALQNAIDLSTTPYETGSSDVVEMGRGTFFTDGITHSNVVEIEGKGKHVTTIKWSGDGGATGASSGLITPQAWKDSANYPGPQIILRGLCLDASDRLGNSKSYGAIFQNYNFILEECIVRGSKGSEVLIGSGGPTGTGAAEQSGGTIRNCQIGQGSPVTADNGIEFRDPAAKITDFRMYGLDIQVMNHNGIVWSGGSAAGIMMQAVNIAVAGDYSLSIRNPGKAANAGNFDCAGNCQLVVADPSLGVSTLANMTLGGRMDVVFDVDPAYAAQPLSADLFNVRFGPDAYLVHYGTKPNHVTLIRGGYVRVANPFRKAPGSLGRIVYRDVYDMLSQQLISGTVP